MNPSNIAKDKFSKILKAYETLHDTKQRQLYDLEHDYSDKGTWKGFGSQNYGEYDLNPRRRRRGRGSGTSRHKSQGFWDSQHDSDPFKKQDEEQDVYDEFFFTGKRGSSAQDWDKTKGNDLKIDIKIDFMDAIHGCNHKFEVTKNTVCHN